MKPSAEIRDLVIKKLEKHKQKASIVRFGTTGEGELPNFQIEDDLHDPPKFKKAFRNNGEAQTIPWDDRNLTLIGYPLGELRDNLAAWNDVLLNIKAKHFLGDHERRYFYPTFTFPHRPSDQVPQETSLEPLSKKYDATVERLKNWIQVGQQFETTRNKNIFVVECIEETGIRIQTKVGKWPKYLLKFTELNAVIHHFEDEKTGGINGFVGTILGRYGMRNPQSEVHLYVVARDYIKNNDNQFLSGQHGEESKFYREGLRRLVQHSRNEVTRCPKLILDAKRKFKKEHGLLKCEVCKIIPSQKYAIGDEIIEGHHLRPLAKTDGEHQPTTDDIMLLCPNCHRATHRFMIDCKYAPSTFLRETLLNKLLTENQT